MQTAIATLKTVARQRCLAGELNRSTYGPLMTQLREIANELAPPQRRQTAVRNDKQYPDAAAFAEAHALLDGATETQRPLQRRRLTAKRLAVFLRCEMT
jgi:hypothetical protein